jgi:hypothetical protein
MSQPPEPPDETVAAARELDAGLAELQRLLIQTLDQLAERVLGQIQTTRTLADQTAAQRAQMLAAIPAVDEAAQVMEAHLRRLSWRFNDALRNLPEQHWDSFVDTCIQIADLLREAEETSPGGS